MCLAVPMQLIEINSPTNGKCELNNSYHDVDLSMIEDPQVGDFLIVHAGFAIEKLDKEEADKRIKLFEEFTSGNINI